ncbi:hypothetical protein RBH29_15300 [Herbivorax sp. ANBcel31]|uniref:hypothetical protein n=1 Tax=Herbivorax sp. ANBcel31 TaxID=3069754 RepID=UPI0027B83C3A|nr:hypothetical protein [Herbivorax sp. ANBcel31]MDQ2087796.1 hypothetical protein [Herbivorax sp. ANBcel31]
MSKKNLAILLGVFILVAAVFFAKGITQEDSGEGVSEANQVTTSEDNDITSSNDSLKDRYERIKNSDKPSIIVFSYEGECCPGTKQFFDAYNEEVKAIMRDYEGKFETLFIDLDGVTYEQGQVIDSIAEENGIDQMASLVIRDRDGNPQKLVAGPFDSDEIRSLMDEVL